MTFKKWSLILLLTLALPLLPRQAEAEPIFTSPFAAWETRDGPYTVEHLAGTSSQGELRVFFRRARTYAWQVVNVSQAVGGQQIVGPVVGWQTSDGPYTVEHLAAQSPGGDLLVFWWTPQVGDWRMANVSRVAGGQKISGPVTTWQKTANDANGSFNVEYLAGQSPTGDHIVFFWSPRADWQVRRGSRTVAGVVPVIFIDTPGAEPDKVDLTLCPEPKIDGQITIIEDHNGAVDSKGALDLATLRKRPAVFSDVKMEIKPRGHSSTRFIKKNYTIELKLKSAEIRALDETTILGMPAGRKWVLHSCYLDLPCLGNVLSYSLAGGMMAYAPRTRFVELVLNNDYRGLYVLTEKIEIDRARVDLASDGYLYERDIKPTEWTWQSKFPNPDWGPMGASDPSVPGSNTQWTIDVPEPPHCKTDLTTDDDFNGGTLTRAQKELLQRRMDELETNLVNRTAVGQWWLSPPRTGYRSLIDAPSWVDYSLLQEFAFNADGYYKSWYGTYAGGRFRMGPVWDFDYAYTSRWSGTASNGWLHAGSISWEFRKMWMDAWFKGQAGYRWRYLRDARNPTQLFSLAGINQRIDHWVKFIEAAQKRDQKRWDGVAGGERPRFIYSDEVMKLKQMIEARLAWLDGNVPIASDPIVFP